MFGILLAATICCHRDPVSCNFVGAAGQHFTYAGRPYVLPGGAFNAIEIISEQDDRCTSDPRALHVASDKFGMWTMRLPAPEK